MTVIASEHAPAAIGPYAQAVDAGEFVFCSGQIPLHPRTLTLVGTTAAEQTRQVLENLTAVLAAAGLTPDNVVKTTVFMTDLSEFAAMNEVYAAFFGEHRPARAAVQVAALPRGAKIEIECIAQRRPA
ncbi:MAG: RidA family protein [Lentisphaeria bacterium]|nr:RidA family protein [Lentisphaeria bacterium]